MLSAEQLQHRRRAAAIARAFYDRRIDFGTLMREIGEPRDPDVFELVDMIMHEPPVEGLGGVCLDEHGKYMSGIRELIDRLSS